MTYIIYMVFPVYILQCGNKFLNVQLNAHCHKNVHNLNYSVKANDIVDKNTIGKIDDKNL
jgi:hypothetical protein